MPTAPGVLPHAVTESAASSSYGSIVECDLTNVLLATPTSDDSGLRYVQSWPESRAYGTSITSLNELTVKIY